MNEGQEFDGVRIGRPAVAGLVAAGFTTIDELPEQLEELTGIHGVGPKAIRLLRDERTARRR